MKKRIAVALLLILGLIIPNIVSAASTPAGDLEVQKPVIPQDFVIQTPSDPDPGDPQVPLDQEQPCGGQAVISIDMLNDLDPVGDLTNAITNYRTHPDLNVSTFNSARDRYELCFAFPSGPVSINNTISIVPMDANETKGLAIYDLNLRADGNLPAGDPVVQVNFPIEQVEVELINLSMNNVVNGLIANGSQLNLTNATITGNGSGVEGNRCVELNGANNSVIEGSTISDCYIGVHVLNSANTRIGGISDMTGKNTITDNAKGILVEGSSAYKHGYNLIYGNDRIDEDFLYAVEIVDYPAPDMRLFESITEIVGGKPYALDCKTDPETPRMTFSRSGGSVQLYLVDQETKQAFKYFMTCDLSSSDVYAFSAIPQGYEYVYDGEGCSIVDQNNNVVEVTGFHTSTHSSELMPSVKLEGLPPVIFAESEGADIPTAPADDSGDEVTLTSGATGAAEGGGGEMVALGAKGGCMGGSSLLPNDVSSTYAPHLGMWWIIFSIAFLASMRFAKVRNRRRKK